MAELSETSKEMMNKLYGMYGLTKDDIFAHKHYKIITRQGIEKILAGANIKYDFDVVHVNDDNVFLKGKGIKVDGNGVILAEVVTTASASASTTNAKYFMEIAEKRFMSRVALKLEGLYQLGFFGEEESDDFIETGKKTRALAKSV
jgi:DNA polymerase elongation subunit (family B)